jgi:hypothetical protein
MTRTLTNVLLVSILLAGGVAANAQYNTGGRDYASRDRAVFDRARGDLDRASHYPYASRADR